MTQNASISPSMLKIYDALQHQGVNAHLYSSAHESTSDWMRLDTVYVPGEGVFYQTVAQDAVNSNNRYVFSESILFIGEDEIRKVNVARREAAKDGVEVIEMKSNVILLTDMGLFNGGVLAGHVTDSSLKLNEAGSGELFIEFLIDDTQDPAHDGKASIKAAVNYNYFSDVAFSFIFTVLKPFQREDIQGFMLDPAFRLDTADQLPEKAKTAFSHACFNWEEPELGELRGISP